MSLHRVSLREAESQLAELIDLAGKGEEVVISCDDGSVVKLIIEPPADRTQMFGLYEGQIKVSDDFDEELSEGFWLGYDPS